MHDDFPELKVSQNKILEILHSEEEAFIRTLKRGGNLLGSVMKKAQASKEQLITGDDAFKLKDTYGLPLEEIQLMAKDTSLTIDLARYQVLEKKAKETSKKAKVEVTQKVSEGLYKEFLESSKKSEFCGYEAHKVQAKVLGLLKEGEWVDKLSENEKGVVLLDRTPFYAEMGGQLGDMGTLFEENSTHFEVTDTNSPYTGLVAHHGELKKGSLKVGNTITAEIDLKRRRKIEANHTATHLLHWAPFSRFRRAC